MLGHIERCWARCGSTTASSPLDGSGGPLELAFSTAMAERRVSVYGHIWDVLDAFFLCVVGPRLTAHAKACPPSCKPAIWQIRIPAADEDTRRIARHLRVLFQGPGTRLRIVPEPTLPKICHVHAEGAEGGACCVFLQGGTSEEFGAQPKQRAVLRIAHPTPANNPQHMVDYRRSFRRVVWSNLGRRRQAARPDTVLFVSNMNASSGRRIAAEPAVVRAVRAYFAHAHPLLRFMHVGLETLSYEEELRLLRRTHVYISLFGSSLHNCRFLPEGSFVIELHGALKHDYGKEHGSFYFDICARECHLRWAGFAVDGAVPWLWKMTAAPESSGGEIEWIPQWHRQSDSAVARVDARGLVALIDAALQGRWSEVAARYASASPDMFGNHRSNAIAAKLGRFKFVHAFAKLPQYRAMLTRTEVLRVQALRHRFGWWHPGGAR